MAYRSPTTSQLFIGHEGMPRRYYRYLPEYERGMQVIAAGALMLCVALTIEAALWLRGRGIWATSEVASTG